MIEILPVTHDLGEFKVRRTLPSKQRTMVGPFIFVDQFGPAFFDIGQGMDARVMLLGGEAFSEPRHVWWNFVSSDRDRINQAKDDWKSGRFPTIPGDDKEFIPIPEVPLTRSEH